MPFGINSASEVFQRRIHELIEGLQGIEVFADELYVVGYGDAMDGVIADHDRHLISFLEHCAERHVTLNVEKFELRKTEALFIGHVSTGRGMKIYPDKVSIIVVIPELQDVPAV